MKHPGFVVEFNNPTKYASELKEHLLQLGVKSRQLVHKTAWWVGYGEKIYEFKELRKVIAKSIKVNGGSALLISMKSGDGLVIRWKNKKTFYKTKIRKGS
jgi:hypothetical protein